MMRPLKSLLFLCSLAISLINVEAQTIDTFPYFDNLETWDTCDVNCNSVCIISSDWSNAGNIDFKPDSAGTPTALTGPLLDNNPGTLTGIYAVVESSGLCGADTALLESPYVDLNYVIDPKFSFAHHLQWTVAAPDTFEVLVSTDSGVTWATAYTGPDVNSSINWVTDTVDLSAYVNGIIKLQIRFVTSQNTHDFAVDDFAFLATKELNAGIDSVFISSGLCLGDSNELCVNLVNAGTIPIDTVTIQSTLNGGGLFAPFIWTNTLAPGEDTIICIGTTLLNQGDSVAFYAEMPNNQSDTLNLNDTTTISVALNPLPLANAGAGAIQICKDDTITLGGNPTTSAGFIVVWSPGINLDDSTIFNPLLTANTNDTIILMVTDNLTGCQNSDTVTITVDSLPIMDAGLPDTICAGDSTTIGGTPTMNLAGTVSWSPGAVILDSIQPNPTVFPTQDTMFYVTGTTLNGCQGIDSVIIKVDTTPIIQVAPIPQVCLNDPAQLQVAGGITYLWSNPEFLNDSSLSNPIATPPGNFVFNVTVTDANGCFDTANVNVNFDTLPLVDAGLDDTICIGESTQLQASQANNYVWTPAASLSNATIEDPLASPTVNTTYYVTGTDANGCTGTDSVDVTVNLLPNADAGPDTVVCQVDSVQIGGSPTGPGGATYAWNNANLNSQTVANPQFLAGNNAAGNYNIEVEVTDLNGCVNTDQVVVTIHALPNAQIAPINTTICIGETLSISASGGIQYQWSPAATLTGSNTANTSAFPVVSTTYTVTVTDANGCSATDSDEVPVFPLTPANAGPDVSICQQDTITLGASGGVNYIWNNQFLLDGENTATPRAYPIQTTTFTVTVTDANGCSETDDMTITVNPLPIAAGGPDRRICLEKSVQIGGTPTGPVGAMYSWLPVSGLDNDTSSNPIATPIKTTTYRVTVTSVNGCSDSADVLVEVDTLPIVEVIRSLSFFCKNDTGKIVVTPGFREYEWSPNQAISDFKSDSISVYPKSNKEYTVIATDANGCSSSVSENIRVWSLPTIIVSDEAEICEGDSTQIEASSPSGVLYAWSNGISLKDSTSKNTIAKPTATTDYIVTITDTNGCENMETTTVLVFPKPVIEAGMNIDNCDIDVVQIGGEPSGPADAIFSWSPQIGLSNPFSPNPTVLNPEATVYYLEVQDRNGCFNIDSVLVNADCFSLVYAPSAFSPGSNDLNDEFKLEHYRLVEPELTIFNKWGNVVFETTDLDKGWDGTYSGEPAQSDTYYWFLSYKTHDLRKANKEGTITLIR